MGRTRDPRREEAFALWEESQGKSLLKDIAAQLGVSSEQVRKWKSQDKWLLEEKVTLPKTKSNVTKKRGAPKGSKNALGNRGGPGGPPGNKKTLTTGEYEAIWFDCLDEEELALCQQINMDKRVQLENEMKLLEVRERRMLKRIEKLMSGLSEKEKTEVRELRKVKQPYRTSSGELITINVEDLVVTKVDEKIFRTLDDLIKIEEALTRVQEKKQRAIDILHRIEMDEERLALAREKLELERIKAQDGGSEGLEDLLDEVLQEEGLSDE